jgi:hypothetical protein
MISVLIPYRGTSAERIRLWEYLHPIWRGVPDVELCIDSDGREHGEPFSYARAVNRCRARATGDLILLWNTDQLPPTPAKFDWLRARLAVHPWSAMYRTTRILGRHATRHVLAGADPVSMVGLGEVIGCCTGCLAMHAEVFDHVGGFDERFVGWGAEDNAFRLALLTHFPDGNDEGDGEVVCLWHPPAPRDHLTTRNVALFHDLEAAAAAGQLHEAYRGGLTHG